MDFIYEQVIADMIIQDILEKDKTRDFFYVNFAYSGTSGSIRSFYTVLQCIC